MTPREQRALRRERLVLQKFYAGLRDYKPKKRAPRKPRRDDFIVGRIRRSALAKVRVLSATANCRHPARTLVELVGVVHSKWCSLCGAVRVRETKLWELPQRLLQLVHPKNTRPRRKVRARPRVRQ